MMAAAAPLTLPLLLLLLAGGLVGDLLKAQGAKYEYATARLEDRAAVLADIERVRRRLAACPGGWAAFSVAPAGYPERCRCWWHQELGASGERCCASQHHGAMLEAPLA